MRLMLILQFIIGLQSQIIYFTNFFDQADILILELVLIELPRYFKSDGVQGDAVLRFKKAYMVKPKPHAYVMKSCKNLC